jgi:ATP-dependent DNA helicase RecG
LTADRQRLLDWVVRPLRFAAGREFENLRAIKDLEKALIRAAEKAREQIEDPVFSDVARLAKGLDDLPFEEKRSRAQAILQLLDAPKPKPKTKTTGRVPMAEALPETPLERVVGVGPKTAEYYRDRDMFSVKDALFFLPRRFEDRSTLRSISDLKDGESGTVRGTVLATAVRHTGRGKRIFELVVADGTGRLSCKWFRFKQSAMENKHRRGQHVMVSGKVGFWGASVQMVHPDVEVLGDEEDPEPPGVLPIYGEIAGVPPKKVRAIQQGLASSAASHLEEHLPEEMLQRLELRELATAIARMHLPEQDTYEQDRTEVHRRLAFDELFFLQLALTRSRNSREAERGIAHPSKEPWPGLAKRLFPFELTGAQRRVIEEIVEDLTSPRPMNRLLQGDVGSGKTAVAMLMAAIVKQGRRQTALLAPTEILAEQHQRSAQKFLEPNNIRCTLLTGSTRAALRKEILGGLRGGTIDLLIGTHAILEPGVEFADLGLVVVDEQHRFGVEQRGVLREKAKGATPDVLVMTATPIPRTLTLTVYGELRSSTLDELPPGRTPTETRVYPKSERAKAWSSIASQLAEGRQAYVVYPLVEASEKLDLEAATEAVEELRARFAPHAVGLLHGRMRPEEKQATMHRFVAGEIAVLVSTTVVEVGVDVANATVMAVVHAERFGLSQLHQLRGRVGRGAHRGLCILIAGAGDRERLAVLAKTNDGFVVAEKDLELRGPGEVLGTKQHGVPELMVADLVRDRRILEAARKEAERLIAEDAELLSQPKVRAELLRRYGGRFGLARIG